MEEKINDLPAQKNLCPTLPSPLFQFDTWHSRELEDNNIGGDDDNDTAQRISMRGDTNMNDTHTLSPHQYDAT